jgi:mono/diheme cytochrome c family protein
MLRRFLVVTLALAASSWNAIADDGPAKTGHGELVAQVQTILAAKCAECHGDGSRPRRGMSLNLRELAANSHLVVPFRPENSKLWELVRDGDMPEEGSKAGPMTAAEKETIRTWIAAGAPTPRSSSSEEVVTTDAFTQETVPLATRLLRWFGKFHLLVIHFPIALLATAAGTELFCAWRGNLRPSPIVRLCLLLGAAGALVAVMLGWMHADSGGYGAGSSLLVAHRWLGTAAGLWAVAMAIWSEAEARRDHRSWRFRLFLLPAALLVGAAAHLGGILVHGEQFFDW